MTHLSLEPGKRKRVHVEFFLPGGAVAAAPWVQMPGAVRALPLTDGHQPLLPRLTPPPVSRRRQAAAPPSLSPRLPLRFVYHVDNAIDQKKSTFVFRQTEQASKL